MRRNEISVFDFSAKSGSRGMFNPPVHRDGSVIQPREPDQSENRLRVAHRRKRERNYTSEHMIEKIIRFQKTSFSVKEMAQKLQVTESTIRLYMRRINHEKARNE